MTEEITVEATSGGNQPPTELKEKAKLIEKDFISRLKENRDKASAAAKAAADKNVGLAAAERTLSRGYQYWDIVTFGPYQNFGVEPPYKASKVIAAGEWAVFYALVWINPKDTPDGGYPGTEYFAGRNYNGYIETINLTTVTDGPDHHWPGTFDSPAQEFNLFDFWFHAPDPGPKPNLYEVNFTIDLVRSGLSAAAFNTWHYDPDFEPGIGLPSNYPLDVPFMGSRWQHDIPARFLVYHK